MFNKSLAFPNSSNCSIIYKNSRHKNVSPTFITRKSRVFLSNILANSSKGAPQFLTAKNTVKNKGNEKFLLEKDKEKYQLKTKISQNSKEDDIKNSSEENILRLSPPEVNDTGNKYNKYTSIHKLKKFKSYNAGYENLKLNSINDRNKNVKHPLQSKNVKPPNKSNNIFAKNISSSLLENYLLKLTTKENCIKLTKAKSFIFNQGDNSNKIKITENPLKKDSDISLIFGEKKVNFVRSKICSVTEKKDSDFKGKNEMMLPYLNSAPLSYAISTTGESASSYFKKENQDRYITLLSNATGCGLEILGVLDGHGPHGHLAAGKIKDFFFDFFTAEENKKRFRSLKDGELAAFLRENDYDFIRKLVKEAEKTLIEDANDLWELSGCTLNLNLILKSKYLINVNIGDSRTIIVNKNKTYSQISTDHKPNLIEERKRIISHNGRVERNNGSNIGPYRVWLKDKNLPGLAMSRSIGDYLAKKIGVISDPDISCMEITSEKTAIICATDGLWEYVSNEKVSNLVCDSIEKHGENAIICAQILEKNAVKMWKMNGIARDDISIVVRCIK